MHTLELDRYAIEFLQSLPHEISRRIWSKLLSTKEHPRRFFEKLAGRKDYKLRIGDYRAIADLDDSLRVIRVTLIGHRKNVYSK